jgi:hypothetical protein
MKYFTCILLFSVSLLLFGCKEKATEANDEFSNKLTLGTGLNPSNLFQLTGEGTTFSKNIPIFFRLESKDDMAGSAVRIKIELKTNGTYSESKTFDYPNPQSYGHILLSSFTLDAAGSFRATGILVAGSKTVATKEFVVN